jgi:hypothetical protein
MPSGALGPWKDRAPRPPHRRQDGDVHRGLRNLPSSRDSSDGRDGADTTVNPSAAGAGALDEQASRLPRRTRARLIRMRDTDTASSASSPGASISAATAQVVECTRSAVAVEQSAPTRR